MVIWSAAALRHCGSAGVCGESVGSLWESVGLWELWECGRVGGFI